MEPEMFPFLWIQIFQWTTACVSKDDLNLNLKLYFINAADECRRLHLKMELVTCDKEDKVWWSPWQHSRHYM